MPNISGIGIVRVPSGMMHEHALAVERERAEAVGHDAAHVAGVERATGAPSPPSAADGRCTPVDG